ncbi:ATP-binding protein [Stetteria hydrogenophila]
MPRPLRLLPSLAAIGLIVYAEGSRIPGWLGRLLAPAALAAGAALAAVVAWHVRRRWGSGEGLEQSYAVEPVGGPAGISGEAGEFVVYEVEALGDGDAAGRFVEALKERAKSGVASYVLVTSMDRGVASYLVVKGKAWNSALVEAEIVKSLASAVGGVRLRRVDAKPFTGVASLPDKMPPSTGGSGGAVLARIPLHWEARESGGGRVVARLGERVDPPGGEAVLRDVDIEGHVAIFGSTGSGKSTTAALLACSLSQAGFDVVVLDWTGEYPGKLPCAPARVVRPISDPAPVDPVILAGSGDVELAVETISRALSLTPPQEYLLSTVMERFKPHSLQELASLIAGAEEQARWDREVKRALLRKLGSLTSGRSKLAFTGSIESPFFGEGLTVVRLDEIRVTQARRAYVLFLTTWAYTLRYSQGGGRKTVYVIDEAHNIFNHPEAGIMESMVAEARKYGLHFVVITQSPAAISNNVLLNTNTKIIHALRSGRDKDVVAEAAGLPPRVIGLLDKLKPGEAVLVSPSNPEPALVKVKLG